MKKIAILTSLLALTACGGGSGGGDVAPTNDPVITQDMINTGRVAQSQDLQKKLDTIKYVEDNLGSLLENKELTGANINQSRSATTDRMLTGLTLKDINARYQQALEYFGILQKVLNADTNTTETITNKEIKIAYSLSSAKPYDKITQADLPGINIEKTAEETTVEINTVFSSIQITITDKIETNIDLKESVSEEVTEIVPVLETVEEIDHNAALINPNLLKNLNNIKDLETIFPELAFKIDEETGRINAIEMLDEESDDNGENIVLQRKGNTSSFGSDRKLYYFSLPACNAGGDCHNISLEAISVKYETRKELADAIRDKILKDKQEHENTSRYYFLSETDLDNLYNKIINEPDLGEWGETYFEGTLNSLGKVNGLQYSDFGYYTIEDYMFTWTYEGGMNDKKMTIDPSKLAQNEKIVFQGQAVGNLQQNYYVDGVNQSELPDSDEANNRVIETNVGAASLTFEKEKETLNMPFNNWYTVKVVKKGDYVDSIDFTGDESQIPQEIRLYTKSVTYTDQDNCNGNCGEYEFKRSKGDQGQGTQTRMTTTYYGESGVPHEATAFINHVDENNFKDDQGRDVEDQVWFDVVFGGTKQQQ